MLLASLLMVFHLISGAPLNLTEICSDIQENLIHLGTEQKNPEINLDLFEGDILGISSVEEVILHLVILNNKGNYVYMHRIY